MHEAAGLGAPGALVEPIDLIDSYDEYEGYKKGVESYHLSESQFINATKAVVAADEAWNAETTGKAVVDEAKAAVARKELDEAKERLAKMQLGSYVKYFKENHIPDAKAAALAAIETGELGKVKPYAQLDTWP